MKRAITPTFPMTRNSRIVMFSIAAIVGLPDPWIQGTAYGAKECFATV
jgi:hypothetical protein